MNRNAFLELNLIFSHFHLPPHRLILSIRLWELNLSDNQETLITKLNGNHKNTIDKLSLLTINNESNKTSPSNL
ncbi:hypothetical protein EAE92_13590 [Photorhabdus hainanensis]|nr:hypothetical protein [Photorhabdus hainanensis]